MRCFRDLFQTFGRPRRIRSDNGHPFASTAIAGLSHPAPGPASDPLSEVNHNGPGAYPGTSASGTPTGSRITAYVGVPSAPIIVFRTWPPSASTRRRLSARSPTGR